jgi:hypothetical protein
MAKLPWMSTVYQRPECETNYLGERRCPDCPKRSRRQGGSPFDGYLREP